MRKIPRDRWNNPQDFNGATRSAIFGWLIYDWANSAFSTTVMTVLVGPYLTELAQRAVGANGTVLSLGPFGAVTAKSLFPLAVSASVFIQVPLLPLLGIIADYGALKKRLMMVFCYVGVIATCLLIFVTGRWYLLGAELVVVANFSYCVTLGLYNAFLNDIARVDQRDDLSSRGYALGYLGGGLLLAVNLWFIDEAPQLGLSPGLAVRLSLMSAGLWWGGFAAITFNRLPPRAPLQRRSVSRPLMRIAFTGLRRMWHTLGRLPQTRRYLLAYMAFNDGVQTVIAIASVFLAQELFVSRGQPVNESFLVGLVLMVQFVAFFGSMLFARIAALLDTKKAILISLVMWVGVVVYAYGFLQTVAEAWIMGAVIAIVLGGSQALSRSLFSKMIPLGQEGSFFGLYEIAESGTSWIGPLIFGVVVGATGSYRQAILSLVVLFGVGILLLFVTNTDLAIQDAGNLTLATEQS